MGCMITAAQYDVRCPICRRVDSGVTLRQAGEDADTGVVGEFERITTAYHTQMRSYNAKRNRLIRKDPDLRVLRDRLKHARDDELSRHWTSLQRRLWREDAAVVNMKRMRANSLRRWRRLNSKLEVAVEQSLRPLPSLFVLTR